MGKPAKKAAAPTLVEKPPETKEQKLVRLTNARMTKTLKAISLIGNLATYKPTQTDVDAIEQALGEACVIVIQRLRGAKRDTTPFTLRTATQ